VYLDSIGWQWGHIVCSHVIDIIAVPRIEQLRPWLRHCGGVYLEAANSLVPACRCCRPDTSEVPSSSSLKV
jgi:hypothetical protein